MSQWHRGDSKDPPTRKSRSSALLSDLNTPDRAPSTPPPTVPQWLVEQQRHHVRTAGQNEPPSPPSSKKNVPKKQSSKKETERDAQRARSSSAAKSPPDDDDFIMVDLLDGAHLPTKSSPATNRLTSNSDSIISLPPIDEEMNSRWHQLKQDFQQNRRLHRAGASIGPGTIPEYVQSARRPRARTGSQTFVKPSSFTGGEATSAFCGLGASERLPAGPSLPQKVSGTPALSGPGLTDRPFSAINLGPESSVESLRERISDRGQMGRPSSTRDLKAIGSRDVQRHGDREILPLLHGDGVTNAPPRIIRARGGSFSISRDVFMEDDGLSTGESSIASRSTQHGSTNRKRSKRRRRRGDDSDDDDFRPSAWCWRMPADEDAVMPRGAWVYLPLIGWLTFMIAASVNSSSSAISKGGIVPLAEYVGGFFGVHGVMLAMGVLRGIALAASFVFVLYVSPQYAAGSGIPEMKCVLSGVLMPRMLNWKTLLAKMVGLTFSLSSGISIGRLGPFIHMSGITAALVSKIPWFRSLHASARFQLQALSAAMAAGVGATFGAPIGGTMLSIEVMSTYYYIHWLPMAMYCSIMGYFFVVSLARVDSHSFFPAEVDIQLELETSQRLITYIVLGVLCGVVGAALVQFTKHAFILRRSYFTNSTPGRTVAMLTVFAIGHTIVTMSFGGVLALDQKEGVARLFTVSEASGTSWLEGSWKPFSYAHWNSSLTLAVATAIKFVLTGLSLVMPVPAGTFMPIFEAGALLGRFFGELCNGFSFVDWVDARVTAIIGAAALTAGTLHTTSIAVVMLELTQEAIDVLPLAVGVIVSYGVSKQLCSDLFSELIKIRRLPFILGLRERYPSENKRFYELVSNVEAGSFMSRDFPFVTPTTTKGEVYAMLTAGGKPWINCALLSDGESRRLWGTVSQRNLWDAIGDDWMSTPSQSGDEESGYGSLGRDSMRDKEYIPFLRDFDPKVGCEMVDMGPMQVSVHTPFWKIITLFRMLSMSTMYVVEDGVTVGCVSKAQVISHSINMEDRAKKRRQGTQAVAEKRRKEWDERVRQQRKDPASYSRLASRLSEADLTICNSSSGRRSRQGSMSRSRC